MKLSEVLSSPDNWCKGDYFQNADGTPVNGYVPGGRVCLAGAVLAVLPGDDEHEARCTLYDALRDTCIAHGFSGPIAANDNTSTTFDDVRNLILETEQRLGNKAEEQR